MINLHERKLPDLVEDRTRNLLITSRTAHPTAPRGPAKHKNEETQQRYRLGTDWDRRWGSMIQTKEVPFNLVLHNRSTAEKLCIDNYCLPSIQTFRQLFHFCREFACLLWGFIQVKIRECTMPTSRYCREELVFAKNFHQT